MISHSGIGHRITIRHFPTASGTATQLHRLPVPEALGQRQKGLSTESYQMLSFSIFALSPFSYTVVQSGKVGPVPPPELPHNSGTHLHNQGGNWGGGRFTVVAGTTSPPVPGAAPASDRLTGATCTGSRKRSPFDVISLSILHLLCHIRPVDLLRRHPARNHDSRRKYLSSQAGTHSMVSPAPLRQAPCCYVEIPYSIA